MSPPSFEVVALDMDGTLLTSDHQISPATQAALGRARDQGVTVLLVTGRHFMTALPYHYQLNLDSPIVCGNGAYLYDPRLNAITRGAPLPGAVLPDLFEQMRRHEVRALMHLEAGIVYEDEGEHIEHIQAWRDGLPTHLKPTLIRTQAFESSATDAVWKLELFHSDTKILSGFIDDIAQPLGLSCEWSSPLTVDLVQRGNSKGNRLAEWADARGITMDKVIAFGDNYNDISMFEQVGLGVAMGNALPSIQQHAHRVTFSNDEDGIAAAIDRWVL